MIRYIGLIIMYLLLGISIGTFEWYVCQPFMKNMTDKLFPLEKIRHKRVLHNFADLVTAMLSAIGGIIIAIPAVYLLATAKHLPLNLAFLNLICALALTIGYIIAGN